MKKHYLILFALLTCLSGYGQQDQTLQFMPEIGQHIYTNPAFTPTYKVNIGLPGISSNYLALANTGFTYNDVIEKRTNGNLYLNLNGLPRQLEEKNYLQADASLDLLHVSFGANPRLFLSFNATVKSFKRVMYPGDLVDFVIAGNEPFIGQELGVSPEVESASYLEVGLGASYQATEKLSLGARVKLLGGIESATTQHADLHLMTEADTYHLSARADASLLTSNFQRMDEEGLDAGNVGLMNNLGVAVDLGATYEVNDRLRLGLSLLDLGAITWKENTYEYYLNPERAEYTFRGAPVDQLFEEGEAPYNAIIDSIQENFEFQERSSESYTTSLPVKSYLSGSYKLSPSLTTGAAVFLEHYQGRWNSGFSLNLAKGFGRILSTSISYSMKEASYNNFGAGISLNLAPVQIYVVSDNLLNAAYYGVTNGVVNEYLNNAKSMNLRFGINLVFGRKKNESPGI